MLQEDGTDKNQQLLAVQEQHRAASSQACVKGRVEGRVKVRIKGRMKGRVKGLKGGLKGWLKGGSKGWSNGGRCNVRGAGVGAREDVRQQLLAVQEQHRAASSQSRAPNPRTSHWRVYYVGQVDF